jgi:hypothetical protein
MGDEKAKQAAVPPIEAVEGDFTVETVEDKKGNTKTTTVKVTCGASESRFNIAGQTISAVRRYLTEGLNIGSDVNALINGEAPKGGETYVLQPGDNLEFVKQSGRKG